MIKMKRLLILFGPLIFLYSCSERDGNKNNTTDELGLIIYNKDSATNDFTMGKLRFFSYGLKMMIEDSDLVDTMDKRFVITDEAAADCEVTEEFEKGVEEYNAEMMRLIIQKNGKTWKVKYDSIWSNYWRVLRIRELKNDSIEMAKFDSSKKNK